MKLFKNDQGDVKLIWKVLLLVGGFFVVAILLKELLVWLTASNIIHEEIVNASNARDFISEDLTSGNLLALAEGIVWFILVWILVSIIEKRPLKSQLMGLQWKKSSIWMIAGGIILAAVYVFMAIGFDQFLMGGQSGQLTIELNTNTSGIVFTIGAALVLAFSQELVFRSYLQDLMIEKLGVGGGVTLTAIIFIFCSVIFRILPIIELLSGFVLYLIIGYIYYRVRSLYLVGIFHASIILFPTLLGVIAPGEERFLVSVIFMIAGFYYFNRKDEKAKQKMTKKSGQPDIVQG